VAARVVAAAGDCVESRSGVDAGQESARQACGQATRRDGRERRAAIPTWGDCHHILHCCAASRMAESTQTGSAMEVTCRQERYVLPEAWTLMVRHHPLARSQTRGGYAG